MGVTASCQTALLLVHRASAARERGPQNVCTERTRQLFLECWNSNTTLAGKSARQLAAMLFHRFRPRVELFTWLDGGQGPAAGRAELGCIGLPERLRCGDYVRMLQHSS